MRVSNRFLYYQLVKDIGSSTDKMFELNKQISSGKQLHRPSEDPVGMASVLDYRTQLNEMDQFGKSINLATGWLNHSDSILQDVDQMFARAKELATQESSDTASAKTRAGAAEEIAQIRQQLVSVANSKYGNKFMFGGTQTQTAPFLDLPSEKWLDDVTGMIDVDPGTLPGSYPAGPAAGDRYVNTFDGHIHSYDGATWSDLGAPDDGSGVLIAGTSDLHIYKDGAWTTQYQGNDTRFTTRVGKSDDVDINIPGDELFRNSRGDAFMALLKLEKSLNDNDVAGISASLDEIDDVQTVVGNNLAAVGARVNRMENTESVLNRAEVDTKTRVSNIEDLDFAEAITSLKNQQVIYQATLKSTSMITSLSLVDYV